MNSLRQIYLAHFRQVINELEADPKNSMPLLLKCFPKTCRPSILEMISDGPSLNHSWADHISMHPRDKVAVDDASIE